MRRIRTRGALKGVLSSTDMDEARLVEKAGAARVWSGAIWCAKCIPEATQPLGAGVESVGTPATRVRPGGAAVAPHVVALDFGMKWNIARHLCDTGCRVTILPGSATADEVLSQRPSGVFLSNGPGDPEPLSDAIRTVAQLVGQVPIFGICLGHQLLALACGARTFKLKFGHRGANQPVLNLETGRVEITAQNHGFAVEENTLPQELLVTHRNLNDQTIAGLRHRTVRAFSVQYHPEASAGPHDSCYLFGQFCELMREMA